MEHGKKASRIIFSLPSPRALVKIADQKREERVKKRKEYLENSSKISLPSENEHSTNQTSKIRKFFRCLCFCCCKKAKQVHPTDCTMAL
ncbi:hypothetical protein SteCoe_11351 [Stentor coeruleus]|uniref:Uncharacterized protein n=1 Tax=Stentor coeruleus TaxID=5963 RepID=A0A1R2CDE4_9CILI|nr:hypothetical protein SteCoe_11351 [Stentor coeruleus]